MGGPTAAGARVPPIIVTTVTVMEVVPRRRCPPRATMTPSAPLSGTVIGAVMANNQFVVLTAVASQVRCWTRSLRSAPAGRQYPGCSGDVVERIDGGFRSTKQAFHIAAPDQAAGTNHRPAENQARRVVSPSKSLESNYPNPNQVSTARFLPDGWTSSASATLRETSFISLEWPTNRGKHSLKCCAHRADTHGCRPPEATSFQAVGPRKPPISRVAPSRVT